MPGAAQRSILIVSGPLGVGGMTQHMGEFARCAASLGQRVAMLTPAGDGLESIRPLLEQASASIHLPAAPSGRITRADVRRTAGAAGTDWISLCTGALPPDTRIAWRLVGLGLPVIESVHVYPGTMRMKPAQRLFYRLRPKRRYRLLVINRRMLEDTLRLAPSLAPVASLVPYGVDLPEPVKRDAPDGAVTVVSFSRLDESHKDNTTLLRAWAALRPHAPHARLLMLGDGPDRAAMESLASSLGLGESVRFEGWIEDRFAYVRRADIAVLSTRREGLPRVAVESQALGLPIVITDAPGGHDAVEHEQTGLVVPVGDVDAMAMALRRLIDDADLRARFGRAGHERAQRFSIESYTRRLLGIAEELIAS